MFNSYFEKLKNLFDKYESHLSAITLILGFIFDYFTLNRVDFIWDNIFILIYLTVAGVGIVVINMREVGRLKHKFVEEINEFLPFLVQFAFGGLFSAFVIFYSKSASFVSSGVFVLLLFVLLIGNEFFKKSYEKLAFQIALYFVSLFSFSIYFLPVLLKMMGAFVFLLSGAISLVLIWGFIFIISKLSPDRYKQSKNILVPIILLLFASINFLYFTNIIPPIPLSLKTAGVYHFVDRKDNGSYTAIAENDSRWYRNFFTEVIYINSGEDAYAFSSVFAPTNLSTKVIHDWQYFDSVDNKWISTGEIGFTIIGGRDNGFRGFSRKDNIFPGSWRVDIKTDRGQVIGRIRFNVENKVSPNGQKTVNL